MIRNLILLTLVLGLVVPALAADPGNAPGKPMLMDPSKATLKAPDVFRRSSTRPRARSSWSSTATGRPTAWTASTT